MENKSENRHVNPIEEFLKSEALNPEPTMYFLDICCISNIKKRFITC